MTVEEWLGKDNKLGVDIWHNKYQFENETFDEWVDRVAGGNEKIKDLIVSKKFLFGGRILANRRLDKKGKKISLSNCFVSGSKVSTKRGLINIEDVKVGDSVMTHDNTWHTVNHIMNREYSGDLYNIDGIGLYDTIKCTPNHQFLTQNGWKRADRLLAGAKAGRINSPDKLKVPDYKFDNIYHKIDLTEHFISNENKRLDFLDNNKVITKTYEVNHGTGLWKKHGYETNKTILPEDDFMYFIGRWLGDGSITRRRGKKVNNHSILQIVFNKEKEENDAHYIAAIGEKYFGFKPQITYVKSQNVIAVRFESEIIGSWFYGEFGEKCDGKHVPNKYIGNLNMALGLMDADGCVTIHGFFKIVLKNKNMLHWLRDTLYLNGINAQPITEVKGQDDTYMLSLSSHIVNQRLYGLMRKKSADMKNHGAPNVRSLQRDYVTITDIKVLENQKCIVYNLSVENNHSYIVNGVIVHNCYVIAPPEDSIESIFECASKLARTYSYGGGCGVDISKLAPRGAKVNNTAKETSGAVSFMDLYSMVTGLIGQNGRRAALMLSLSCDHPDLEEFISIKSDLDKITKANISVRITDEFMRAARNHEKHKLIFTREATGEHIEKEVDAYEVFHKLCEMNWDYAEPGMLFWDRIEDYNLLSEVDNFSYAGVNPCFSGNMELLTIDGYKSFEELDGTEPYIYNVNGNVVKSKVWCSGIKKTVKVKTAKNEIICTPDHRFMTINGEECMAKDLKGKFIMPCTKACIRFDPFYVKCGFIQGDGQLNNIDSDNYYGGVIVNIGKKDGDILELFSEEDYTFCSNGRSIQLNDFKDKLLKLGVSTKILPNRVFPSTYINWTKNQKASFLHGCYSANGSVIKDGRVSYKTTCKEFANQLVETLSRDFNIQSVYITSNKPKKVRFKNGEYTCRESYDVNIAQYKDITRFVSQINFYQQYKREQLDIMLKKRPNYVYNVEEYDEIPVYDFKEPERHWGIVEGYVVHNCAEEPLPAGGSCLLGSINLSEFVTNDKQFDYNAFISTVRIAVGALNEVLDEGLPLHPLIEQRESAHNWRQIGLGIMGLADMLIKMEIKYGSQEAVEICNKIGRVMAENAIAQSVTLSIMQEPFNMCDKNKITMSTFLHNNATDELIEQIEKYGLRNSQLLTIAPTGSLSTMLGISGGIEPIYANYYERKTESLHGEDVYYKVYTPIVEQYMKENNITDECQLPDYFVTAQSLNYKDRIHMQAIWQLHIDASISSTVNVPNSFTIKDVEKLYMLAWESGLKGITIFRDGCKRVGILSTNNKENKETITKTKEMPRGWITKADDNCIGLKRTLHTGCGTLHCVAMFDPDSGDLLETYLSKGSTGGCHNYMIGLSRMISISARAGIDIHAIVDQLNSTGVCPSYAVRTATKRDTSKGSCCPMAVGNALLDMWNEVHNDICSSDIESDHTHTGAAEKYNTKSVACPQCGEPLIFEGGCNICKNCGWSKCS